MTKIRRVLRRSIFATLAGLLAASAAVAAEADQAITPTASDHAAAREAKRSAIHPNPAHTKAGAAFRNEAVLFPGPPTTPFQNKPRFPADLTYQGGAFVDNAQSHAVYVMNKAVGCTTPGCWGTPETFLQNLGQSDFIHITDQYVNRQDDNRYTNGSHASITLAPLPAKLTDLDVQAAVHAVASQTHETGYTHIYHVFLPPGTDECFDNTFSVCYSPDNPATFVFCAYHSSTDFSDIGHVLYSVEPFQNVDGCNLPPGSPNGQLVDSTASTLSHELFETITDPDGTGWWNTASNDLFGEEVADECAFLVFLPTAVFSDAPVFLIGQKKYAVQAEYSNFGHACLTSINH